MKTIFFELENWEKEYIKGEDFVFVDGILSEDKLPAETDAEIISIFVDSVINEKVLAHFPNLKLICTRSTGYDHIDIEACKAKGVAVATVPSYGEETVAEYAFALMLTLSRKIFEAYDRIKETGSFDLTGMRGFDLNGKTLGVIGTGKIGKNVIEIAKGFNMKVIAYDKFPDTAYQQKMGYEYLTLDEVLAQADIVTLHVPYIPTPPNGGAGNHHMINAEALSKMKPTAYLINTARGALVETDALLKALQAGQLGPGKAGIAGAGLDVLEEEGVIKDELNFLTRQNFVEQNLGGQANSSQSSHDLKTVLENHVLVDMPNVVVTPHNAFNTWEALKRILDTTLENIKNFSAGQPANIVN